MKKFFKSIIITIVLVLPVAFIVVPFSGEDVVEKTVETVTPASGHVVEISRSNSYTKVRSIYDIVFGGEDRPYTYFSVMVEVVDSVVVTCNQDSTVMTSISAHYIQAMQTHNCVSGSAVSLQGPLNSITLITETSAYQLDLER